MGAKVEEPAGRAGVVLLHGAALSRAMWLPVERRLARQFVVLAPDLPGHGTRRGTRFTLAGARAIVAETVARLAAPRVLLVGDSLGGYVALAAADAIPRERLAGLVLAGSSSNLHGIRVLPYLLTVAVLRAMTALGGEAAVTRSAERKLRARLAPDHASAIVAAGISAHALADAVSAVRRVDFRARLADLDAPVLLVNGSRDRGQCSQEAQFLAAARRGERYRFEGCEHGVSLWRAEEFAERIADFARRHVPK